MALFLALLPLLLLSSPPYNSNVNLCAVLSTILVPSLNCTLNNTFAFVKSPFFERDDDELGPLNHMQNMLGVEEIGGDGGM